MSEIDQVRYCIQCGTKLTSKELLGKVRPCCPYCEWVYFPDPKVAAGVLIENGSEVLLIRRVNDPCKGLWSLPAGFVDAYEDPARAAERECLEETGLIVRAAQLYKLISGREHDRGADIVLVYRAQIISGSLKAGDDADRVQFFPRDQLPPLAFKATKVALGIQE